MQNGYFKIDTRPDGAYLIVYAPKENGQDVDPVEITKYLDSYGIDYSKNAVYDLVKDLTNQRETRITTLNVGNLDESLATDVGSGEEAVVRFYPPSTSGRLMDKDEVIFQLGKRGVKFGIDENEIVRFLKERKYCTNYTLARAVPPVEGSDAVIDYHFNTDLTKKPKMNEDGSVDFHQLDTVSLCECDQCLATLTPAVHGKPGTDVLGRAINPQKVVVLFLKQTKNTHLSPDGLNIYSNVNGHVMLTDGQIFVSGTYLVPANVDTSTGDISYNGNVEVTGNVNTGYKVEASGDIIVNGIVEGAELVAGGQIVLKRGIQGMGRGKLKAGTNIVSRFIESAEVYANGFIQTESIMHSNVSAGEEIIVSGRKGFITGGSIRSGRYISAKTAGSVMGTQTMIEVGVNLKLSQEAKDLEAQIAVLNDSIDKADKVVAFITKKLREKEPLPKEKIEQFQTLSSQKSQMEKKREECMQRLDFVNEQLDNSSGGYILVDDIIYPGCKVTVSNVTTFIRTETKHSRLVRDGADIRVAAY